MVAGVGISSCCIGCRRKSFKLLYWLQEEESQVVILVAEGGISSCYIGCRRRNIKLLYWLQEEEFQVVVLVAGEIKPLLTFACLSRFTRSIEVTSPMVFLCHISRSSTSAIL